MLYEAHITYFQDQDLVVCCLNVLKEFFISLTYVKVQIQKWFISLECWQSFNAVVMPCEKFDLKEESLF